MVTMTVETLSFNWPDGRKLLYLSRPQFGIIFGPDAINNLADQDFVKTLPKGAEAPLLLYLTLDLMGVIQLEKAYAVATALAALHEGVLVLVEKILRHVSDHAPYAGRD